MHPEELAHVKEEVDRQRAEVSEPKIYETVRNVFGTQEGLGFLAALERTFGPAVGYEPRADRHGYDLAFEQGKRAVFENIRFIALSQGAGKVVQ